jgi:DNA replication and repair protein RecF
MTAKRCLAGESLKKYTMVDRILVRDFRCFTKFELDLHQDLTCVVGKNALGKTSLLEALAVLIRLQSPRTSSLQSAIRTGARGLVVDGIVYDYHLQCYYSARRRKLALDSVEQKDPSEYLKVGKVVFFANSDIDLIRGSSEGRRRFLDFVGNQLFRNYREIHRSYEKALRSRNAYLKMVPTRPREVAAYTTPLLKFGHQLTALRAFLIERLEPYVLSAFASVSDRGEPFIMKYHPGSTDDFERALSESSAEERRLRATLVGPHRDDVHFLVQSQPADLFASEGQQRTMAIALKLGQAGALQAECQRPPLLLVDDVFGELDGDRRNRLFRSLPADSQCVVTTTSISWLNEAPIGKLYEIADDKEVGRSLRLVS